MIKGLEAFNRIAYPLENRTHKEIEKDLHIIEKSLEALEIIKEKKVQAAIFLLSNSCIGYNFSRGLLGEDLEQEEYDLLKEVLINEQSN